MNIYKFKTNINCGGCIASVTPHLNGNKNINDWKVDTSSPDKVLTVSSESLAQEELKAIIAKAGFNAEEIISQRSSFC